MTNCCTYPGRCAPTFLPAFWLVLLYDFSAAMFDLGGYFFFWHMCCHLCLVPAAAFSLVAFLAAHCDGGFLGLDASIVWLPDRLDSRVATRFGRDRRSSTCAIIVPPLPSLPSSLFHQEAFGLLFPYNSLLYTCDWLLRAACLFTSSFLCLFLFLFPCDAMRCDAMRSR